MDTELIKDQGKEVNTKIEFLEATIKGRLEKNPGGILLDRDNRTVEAVIEEMKRLPDQDRYDVLEAVGKLVPREEEGRIFIGTRELNKGVLNLIFSRRSAKEEESPFLKLPEVVRNKIVNKSQVWMEIGDHCTVACYFCGVANKGTIKTKLSFDDAYQTGLKILGASKTLHTYFATDPFDARWRKDNLDLDLSDLVSLWIKDVGENKNARVGVVSAVPIGEELRVLRFATMYGYDNPKVAFELSQTSRNTERVDAINLILKKLNKKRPYPRNRSDEKVYRTGKDFLLAEDIKPQEMLGPTCGDYVVVSPNSVDAIYSVATDMEYPNGIIRLPIATEKDGKMVYSFPKFHGSPGIPFNTDLLKYVESPDVILMVQKINDEWKVSTEHPLEKNPHRAFLRLLATVNALFQGEGRLPDKFTDWEFYETASAYERMWTPKFLRSDLEIVEGYLEKHNDRWMKKYLDWILKI